MNMRRVLVLSAILIQVLPLLSQINITWDDLGNVKIYQQVFPEDGLTYDVPSFSNSLKELNEKEVLISGYLIPLNNQDQMFVLSKNPYASCFFCGGAGPESVMELWLKPESFRGFQLDERVQFKGTLLLNDNDFDHCIYILKDAVEVL